MTVPYVRRHLAVAFVALALAPVAAEGRTVEVTRSATETLTLGPNGAVDVKNVSGDIAVTAGSGPNVVITITRTARGNTQADAALGLDRVQAKIDHTADHATVDTVYPSDVRDPPYSVSVAYAVTAPPGTHISTHSISGNITVTNMKGEIAARVISGNVIVSGGGRLSDAQSISGDVTVSDTSTEADLSVSTISGTVTLTRVKARHLGAHSVSGAVTVRDAACDGITIQNISGGVTYDGTLARAGHYELSSHSGAVTLSVGTGVGFTLHASTFSGGIHTPAVSGSAVSGSGEDRGRHSVQGTIGDGSAVVTLTSFSGSIDVRQK